ncbi:MAG: hypothetical protein M3O33_11235 [Cyanobacteriota bacterium]|nr:hypothetical protein [Cyanobacteriota bacterium]
MLPFIFILDNDRIAIASWYRSSVTLREGNLQKPYQSINTSYPIRKTWWLYLLLEKNLAISFAGAVGNRFIYKGSRVQKWQMFSESDRRGVSFMRSLFSVYGL